MDKRDLQIKIPMVYSEELKRYVHEVYREEELDELANCNDVKLGEKLSEKIETFPSFFILDMINKKKNMVLDTFRREFFPKYNRNLAYKKWQDEVSKMNEKGQADINYSKEFLRLLQLDLGENTCVYRFMGKKNNYDLGAELFDSSYYPAIDTIVEIIKNYDEEMALLILENMAKFQIYTEQIYDVWKDEYEKFIQANFSANNQKNTLNNNSQPGEN